MRYPEFCGGSYRLANPIAGIEQSINWYPQTSERESAKADVTLEPCPGFAAFCTLDRAPIRGLFSQDGIQLAVADDTLYSINSDGTFTARGNGLNNDGSPVTMVGNGAGGQQVFITSGSKGFIYNTSTNALTQVLNPANFGGFLDGFFLALQIATAQLRVSNLFDGTTWNPTQEAQREFSGDAWKALIVAHRQLWLLGGQTSEVWYDVGSTFPFAPNGATMDYGIVAPYSLALLDNTPIWLTQNDKGSRMVVRGTGDFNVQRISDFGVEYALSQASTLADVVAWAYQERGHTFYVMQVPSINQTWVFDLATLKWHQRGTWNAGTAQYERMHAQFHMYAFEKHLVGDRTTGAIYQMSSDLNTSEDGTGMRRVRRAPHLYSEGGLSFLNRLQLDMEVGIGNILNPGQTPKVMLRFSRDGGQTWGTERVRSIGQIGQYRQRVQWFNCGWFRDGVIEISMTDPVPARIVDAWIDVEATAA